MNQLKIGYQDIQEMPWEYFEWFYNRHTQYLIDLEQQRKEAEGKNNR